MPILGCNICVMCLFSSFVFISGTRGDHRQFIFICFSDAGGTMSCGLRVWMWLKRSWRLVRAFGQIVHLRNHMKSPTHFGWNGHTVGLHHSVWLVWRFMCSYSGDVFRASSTARMAQRPWPGLQCESTWRTRQCLVKVPKTQNPNVRNQSFPTFLKQHCSQFRRWFFLDG